MKIPDSEYRALYSQLADLTEQRDKALVDKGRLEEALRTYADPTFYFGVAFMFDRPTGGFDEDFSEVEWPDGRIVSKPGKLARRALAGVETGRQEHGNAGGAGGADVEDGAPSGAPGGTTETAQPLYQESDLLARAEEAERAREQSMRGWQARVGLLEEALRPFAALDPDEFYVGYLEIREAVVAARKILTKEEA
jgi:hypothetical protein